MIAVRFVYPGGGFQVKERETFSVAVNAHPRQGELTVLFAGHSRTAPDHKVGPQVLDYYLVHAVEAGEGTFSCHGLTYDLHPGDCFFIFPGELVTYCSASHNPWEYRWVGFRGEKADQMLAQSGITPYHPVVRDTGKTRLSEKFSRIAKVLKQGGASSDLAAGGYFRLTLADWLEANEERLKPELSSRTVGSIEIEHAVRWLNLQYSRPVAIQQMARELGYHRAYLSKMFKRHTGLSPIKFLFKLRMERAKTLLFDPLTIEQIAYSVGFSDPLYFSKKFKEYFGCSPTEYRSKSHVGNKYDCT